MEIGVAQGKIGLGLRQLGADVSIFDARENLPFAHLVAFDHAEVDQSPGGLGRDGGFALRDDIPRGSGQDVRLGRRDQHRGGELDGYRAAEPARGENDADGDEEHHGRGNQQPARPAPAGRCGRGVAIDPERRKVGVLRFHASNANSDGVGGHPGGPNPGARPRGWPTQARCFA